MKFGSIILQLFFVMLISCGNDKGAQEPLDNKADNEGVEITTKAIQNLDYSDYVLSNEAEKELANWEKYQELAIQVNYLKKADLSFFNGDKELLKKFLEEFKIGLQEKLKTNPIISRMAIVETSILRLNDNLTLDNISGKDKLESVKEVIVAFSNLNYQINKKLESDKYSNIQPQQ